jgi:uncharacterized membrane protein YbhN (UPF0104 family)
MKKLLRIVNYAFMMLVVLFIAIYIARHFHSIEGALRVLQPWVILASLVLMIIGRLFFINNMRLTLLWVKRPMSPTKCFSIYSLTQLPKYIPGSVMQFVGRAGMYQRESLSGGAVRNALAYEILLEAGSAFFFGLSLLLAFHAQTIQKIVVSFRNVFLILIVLAIVGLIILITLNRKGGIKLFTFPHISIGHALQILLNTCGIWVFISLSCVIILESFMPHPWELRTVLYLMGLYALSHGIGFCVPFAPAGIGIREGVIVLGSAGLIPTETAVLAVSLHRILYFIVDLILGGIAVTTFSRTHGRGLFDRK